MAIDQKPIFIAGPPRSGTIMLAGLLVRHGVWVGRARTTDYPGTNPPMAVENLDIKELMKREATKVGYRNWRVPFPEDALMERADYFKKEIEKFIPVDTRWMVKTSWLLTFDEFWRAAYPHAYWILPVRSEKMIMDSMNRHPSMRRHPDNMKRKFIRALHARQEKVFNSGCNCIRGNVNKISRRNRGDIQALFDFLNMKVDWRIVDEWIDPKLLKRN